MRKIMKSNPFNKSDKRTFKGADGMEGERFCYVNGENIPKDTYVITSYGRLLKKDVGDVSIDSKGKKKIVHEVRRIGNKHITIPIKSTVAKTFVKRTKKDNLYGRDLVHVLDWDKANFKYTNLQWVNKFELNALVTISRKSNDVELIAKYICRFLERGYTINDILHVIGSYIPSEDKRKFVKNIKDKKAFKYLSYDFHF